MDSHCLPWFWLNSIALCNRLHFYSHDFGVRSSISIDNEKCSHHVTNVRQQLTVIGHQRSSSFPCPLPNGIFLFSAKKAIVASLTKVCFDFYLVFFNLISYQLLELMHRWETPVEPEVTVLLTPHWTVRNVVHLFCSFHFICTLERNQTNKGSCPWTVLASFYSFTGFIYPQSRALFKCLKPTTQGKLYRRSSERFGGAPFYHNSSTLFNPPIVEKIASIRIICGVIKVCWFTFCCTGYFLEWYLFHRDLFSLYFESKSKSNQEEDRGCRHVNNISRLKMRMFINLSLI